MEKSGKRKRKSKSSGSKGEKQSRQEIVAQAVKEECHDKRANKKLHNNDNNDQPAALSVQEMSDVIAELSESVLENPERSFRGVSNEELVNAKDKGSTLKSDQPTSSPIKHLLSIAAAQGTPSQEHSAHLSILSLLAIFKDVIPEYRIRLPSEKEMAVKVSRETRQLWEYERSLLDHYQQLLKIMEKTWAKKGKGKDHPSQVAVVAIMAMAELLKSAFHFNFRSNLLTAVIRVMNHPLVGDHCCTAIAHVFAHDSQGEVALEAARQVSKMIQNRNFKVRPAVLKTFVSLPLRVHVDEAQAAKLATKMNAKKRKKDKELSSIEADLKEGEATVDKIALARNQSDTLQAVTLTYFRILKSDNLTATEDVLPVALEGLAKFAHLINIDTVMDLLAVLKELLKSVDTLPLDAALNCILTAFQTLQGPGRELNIDQKEYVLPLYSQIPRITSKENSLKHTKTLLQCLEAAFLKQKEFSNVRVAAFLKQILTTCMHAPHYTTVPLLSFARQLLQRYPSAQQLLENENDVITSGEYTPDVPDPEQSNPYATSGWELASLKFHVHPSVAKQSMSAASSTLLQLPGEAPERLHKEALEDSLVLYIPFQHGLIKKHPLAPKPGSSENSSSKKKRPRFVMPRQSHSSLKDETNTSTTPFKSFFRPQQQQ